MKNLSFSNPWMKLLILNNSKLHYVSHLAELDGELDNENIEPSGSLFGRLTFTEVDRQSLLDPVDSEDSHCAYIQSDKSLFGIGFVSNDHMKINEWLRENDDKQQYAVITSDDYGYHYVVTIMPVHNLLPEDH